MQMQVDFRRREFGPFGSAAIDVVDRSEDATGEPVYCPLRTAPGCPVFSLASSFAASSGVGFSVSARRH